MDTEYLCNIISNLIKEGATHIATHKQDAIVIAALQATLASRDSEIAALKAGQREDLVVA